MRSKNNNPYAKAAGAYDQNAQQNTPDQRELEGRVLLKSARMMQDLARDWDQRTTELLEATLFYNRQIWMLFYDTAIENPEGTRPNDLRSNIVNLANFIFKRELEILSNPQKEKLNVLININKEVAAGLLSNQKKQGAEAVPPSSTPPSAGSSTNIQG
ncbi:MAG: flagellar biosynthesis regulator FlaF [Alphaproteobacteria bacterium]|nr:flagellar biosynthesis regulator FlaF [Alphaproteobacteria bacterium]MCB9974110.1 flagellar biosynthesis regulator FlaF [Rhodospirillales bacterium]